jgi:prepilin-type N-terminal cleavage/methylation domain-containing protein
VIYLEEKMKKNAFTLIELMITVMVIAVLVSIAIPNYINTVERARAREARATLQAMRAAELSYSAERRSFIALPNNNNANDPNWEAVGLVNPNANDQRSWNYTSDGTNHTATRNAGPYNTHTISIDNNGNETVTGGFY